MATIVVPRCEQCAKGKHHRCEGPHRITEGGFTECCCGVIETEE